jgi:hypothetical protein
VNTNVNNINKDSSEEWPLGHRWHGSQWKTLEFLVWPRYTQFTHPSSMGVCSLLQLDPLSERLGLRVNHVKKQVTLFRALPLLLERTTAPVAPVVRFARFLPKCMPNSSKRETTPHCPFYNLWRLAWLHGCCQQFEAIISEFKIVQ